ncbi:MAG: tRNA-dihydrouridine synthase family protein [Lentisphaerae bacterium]|nr:tRNA-dihydrouridine synthase family protein [Lentisphaerota bacterium]
MSQPPPRSRREGNRRVNVASTGLWLAPLRGVTIRAFRTVFADAMREAGFSGAFSPFIPANPGFRRSRKIFDEILPEGQPAGQILVPQAIGKDPWALREWCKAVKDLGYGRADLNAGCPFPMIRKKGRGSGLMRTPDVLDRMLDAGCAEMGPGNFSLKTRLGVESPDEIMALMPTINRYPLAVLTVHARTAVQMYDGVPDMASFRRVLEVATVPVMYNGDATVDKVPEDVPLMIGRGFVRSLANRPDARELFSRYMEMSREELDGDAHVLGRMKELLSYWCQEESWRRLWPSVKICRSTDELAMVCGIMK